MSKGKDSGIFRSSYLTTKNISASIRLKTENSPKNGTSSINDLVTILKPLFLDLIAVQEIHNNERWRAFHQQLSLLNFSYGQGESDQLGNGIASHYPVTCYSNQQSYLPCRGGTRGLLYCRLKVDHPSIRDRIFSVAHSDHLNQDSRLQQIQELHSCRQNIPQTE